MTEQVGVAKQEVVRKGSSLKKRAALTVAAVGAAGIGFLGADREGKNVSAAGDTPIATITRTITPTGTPIPPTLTPTPDHLATPKAELANAQATAQAVNTRLSLEQDRADAMKTVVAAQEGIDALRGTPTKTPTPDAKIIAAASATVQATRDSGYQTRVAAVEQSVTAEAKRPPQRTAEALQTQVVNAKADATEVAKIKDAQAELSSLTPTPTSTSEDSSGRFPWKIPAVVLVAILGPINVIISKLKRGTWKPFPF